MSADNTYESITEGKLAKNQHEGAYNSRNFNGEHFWARGYAVSTVGLEEEVIRTYIRDQEKDEQSAEAGRF
jgi:REP element-mobilizing transposase RayT